MKRFRMFVSAAVIAGGSKNGEVDSYYDMVIWRYQ